MAGIAAIPVFSFDRDVAYQQAVGEVARTTQRGACVRLVEENFESVYMTGNSLDVFMAHERLEPENIDVVLDMRSIVQKPLQQLGIRMREILNGLRLRCSWRSLILAGSNFPKDVTEIKRHTSVNISRAEYRLWLGLNEREDAWSILRFGDYGIVFPEFADRQWGGANINAKIRYTCDSDWLVLRGCSLKEDGYAIQYPELARKLIGEIGYCGESFSWGDSYIYRCARGLVGPGNLSTWVAVDTCHHLELVSAQIYSAVRTRVPLPKRTTSA